MTDIEIARSYKPLPLQEIAKRIGLSPDELYPHGRYKGKVALAALDAAMNASATVIWRAVP